MKQEPIVVLIELYQLHSPVLLSFRRYRYSQLLDRSNVHRLFEAFLTLSLNAPNFHHTTKKDHYINHQFWYAYYYASFILLFV